MRPGIEPATSWFLVGIISTAPFFHKQSVVLSLLRPTLHRISFLPRPTVFFTKLSFYSFSPFPLIDVEPPGSERGDEQLAARRAGIRTQRARSIPQQPQSFSALGGWCVGVGVSTPPPHLSRQVSVCLGAPVPAFAAASGPVWAGTPRGSQRCLHGDERRGGAVEREASFSPAGSSSAPWCPVFELCCDESLMKPIQPEDMSPPEVFLFSFSSPGSKRVSLSLPIDHIFQACLRMKTVAL